MRKVFFLLTLTLVMALAAGSAWADAVTGLTTFTSGTPAIADSVNANFAEVQNSVDDNDTRITNMDVKYASSSGAFLFTFSPKSVRTTTYAAPGPGTLILTTNGVLGLYDHTTGVQDMAVCGFSATQDATPPTDTMFFVSEAIPTDTVGIATGVPFSITRTFDVTAAGSVTYYLNCRVMKGSDAFVQYGGTTSIFISD